MIIANKSNFAFSVLLMITIVAIDPANMPWGTLIGADLIMIFAGCNDAGCNDDKKCSVDYHCQGK